MATKSEVHDIYIDGTEGFVDKTTYDCSDVSCTHIKDKSRRFRKYVYENQRWLMTDDPVACPRKQPYEMEPEFARALSLISQRLQSDNNVMVLKNCINVRYATSKEEINGAEGLFQFIPGQSPVKLDIIVSPQYKEKDDYLTAFILAHEAQHAANYAMGLLEGKPIFGCFEDEANAFNAQYWFLSQLNQEEKNSILSRGTNPSREIVNMIYTYMLIQQQPGSSFVAKATNYVKTDSYYQKQCSGR